MKVYIIETPDGEWFETESTAWKQALRRAPRVNGGMAEMQIQLWQENNPDPIPFFNNPLPNGITGDMIAKYARAKHIEKFLNPQEMNWYAVIAVISVLGLIGAIIALYVGK